MMETSHFPTNFIVLADGRKLAFCEFGDPDGTPVFYFHGTPGSRYEALFSHQDGQKAGFRVISLDRPGFGLSDPLPNRALLDWPADVQQAADQLGFDHFGLIGISGGGPYVLACCHQLDDRIDFATLMGSWAPVAEEPSLWNEMAPLDRFFGKLSKSAPWAFYLPFSSIGWSAKNLSPQNFIRALASSLSGPDKRLLAEPEMAIFFADDVAEGFRQGVRGPADDAMLLYRAWGFRVDQIQTQIRIFHGQEDKFAPVNYALYLDSQLPNSRLTIYPDDGHLFVTRLFKTVFNIVRTDQ